MDIKAMLKDTRCPVTYEEIWEKYGDLHMALNSISLLDYQNINWQPFKTDKFTDPVPVFPGSDNDAVVYTSHLGEDKIFSMVVVERGQLKWIKHYEESGNATLQTHGGLHLKLAAFASTTLKKFIGIATVGSVNDNIVSVSLMPDFDYLDQHDDEKIRRAVHKLYAQNWWTGHKL